MKELHILANQARLIGCDLFVKDDIRLIIRKPSGEVKSKHVYHFADADYIDRIQHHLAKAAETIRYIWGKEFLELAPVAFELGLCVKVGDFSATLIGTANSRSEVSKDEVTLLECPFSSTGVRLMSDYISNLLLGKQDKSQNIEKEEEKMGEVVLDANLAKVITIMYYRMSAKEQQDLKDNTDPEIFQIVKKSLEISAKG